MTTFTQAMEAAVSLIDQLQAFTVDPRFLPRFFDTIFGLRTALGSASDRFAAQHSGDDGDLPVFGTVLDRCEQAKVIGTALAPSEATVTRYAEAVQRAIAALGGQGSPSARPALRGTLRLQMVGGVGFAAAAVTFAERVLLDHAGHKAADLLDLSDRVQLGLHLAAG